MQKAVPLPTVGVDSLRLTMQGGDGFSEMPTRRRRVQLSGEPEAKFANDTRKVSERNSAAATWAFGNA
jgi:hypothetical protein